MPEPVKSESTHPIKLVLIPAVITLAVTLLRLIGELRGWSPRWFSTETGGMIPSGVSWIVGVTWLVLPFGAYFAVRLARAGQGPQSIGRATVLAAAGIVFLLVYRYILYLFPPVGFPRVLILIWLCWAIAGGSQYFGWPALFKVLLCYGWAARIPVAIVMFFAMLGNWGTHYDYVGMPPQFSMNPVPRFLWLAFFPQLVAWVSYTIAVGTLAGVIALWIVRISGAVSPKSKI
jgi:hypothetical protein